MTCLQRQYQQSRTHEHIRLLTDTPGPHLVRSNSNEDERWFVTGNLTCVKINWTKNSSTDLDQRKPTMSVQKDLSEAPTSRGEDRKGDGLRSYVAASHQEAIQMFLTSLS